MPRRPKPTALHRLHRTYNVTDHRSRGDEPQPAGALKQTPSGLTKPQRAAWRYAIANMPPGVLKRIDRGVLLVWIEAEDRHRRAMNELANSALLVMTAHGVSQPSPYIRIIDQAARTMLRAANELGFSPAARPRIHVAPQAGAIDRDDPWLALRLIPGGKSD